MENFDRKVNRILSLTAKKAGKKAYKFFLKNYSKEGKEDTGFVRWADRKKEEKYKKRKLFKTGKMKKSFRLSTFSNSFKIVNDSEYAIYHQQGTSRMPKREILYHSKKLNEEIEKELTKEVQKLMKKMFK